VGIPAKRYLSGSRPRSRSDGDLIGARVVDDDQFRQSAAGFYPPRKRDAQYKCLPVLVFACRGFLRG
jgi:hypothetical protein